MNKNGKNTKIKKLVFFLILFYFLISSISLTFDVWAQEEGNLEVSYPEIPGGVKPPTATKIYLPRYIQYIYNFVVAIGGIIAFLVLVYGGFRFLTSAGNPSAIADARGQILAGFIGFTIILGSYVILYEINPDLVSMRLPKVSAVRSGIILYGEANCANLGGDAAIPELVETEDVLYKALRGSGSVILKEEKDNQEYPLSFFTFHSSDTLRIELFTDEGCREEAEAITNFEKNNCYPMPRNDIKCIKFVWWKPGIWVFNKLDEKGNAPDPLDLPDGWQEGVDYMTFQTTQENLPSGFSNEISAIALVPDKKLDLHYGVILHNLDGQTFMQNKGYSQIILPGNPLCIPDTEHGVTRCDLNNSFGFNNIASITLFNLPKEEASTIPWTVTICRQDRCEDYRPEGSEEDEYFDVQLDLRVGNELQDITPQVGGDIGVYNASENIVFARNLRDLEWLEINESINNGGRDSGVSGVKIETGAPYLVLLYHLYNDNNQYNPVNRGKNSVVVMNRSNTSLRTMKKDDLVGTIVAIRIYKE